MKKIFVIITGLTLLYACGGDSKTETKSESFDASKVYGDEKKEEKTAYADDGKGVGKFTDVPLGATIDKTMLELGTKVYDLKCSACHKLSDEKIVGPGWKGVTARRKVEWVMNFVTNTDEMLEKDPAAQAMLEECLVRMPNQNLSEADARSVYEFMRKNDGVN